MTDDFHTIATGSYVWENKFENGIWTYALDEVWEGIRSSYAQLAEEVRSKYQVTLTKIGAIGVSAMMHGYLAFSKNGELLTPFRTWRNNITEQAASQLTDLFQFNIPERWSIAHLYQAILNTRAPCKRHSFYYHLGWLCSLETVRKKGVGNRGCFGGFPVDEVTGTYSADFLKRFESLENVTSYPWKSKRFCRKF